MVTFNFLLITDYGVMNGNDGIVTYFNIVQL